ncbi:sec-independent protein translocase protein TatA [Kineococcus xinjiangensis]|uniref:Sec-independent protein translocase protein TatA n=1 Tax=Kineococcus xinjiangensis TaxID=512762 RepID=A0A2S6IKE4_9ACTN|nr:Sec-independent protein translocase subunit TatA [Kineococcus xinjiangensis]PPK94703.1 sec-independent protein translocase protein TatA [Kineococcus xinjiangensis]
MFNRLLDSPVHLIILLVLVLLLFGAKRLPDAARGLGRSLRIFKSEVKEMKRDDAPPSADSSAPLEGRVVVDTDAPKHTPSGSHTGAPGSDPHRNA